MRLELFQRLPQPSLISLVIGLIVTSLVFRWARKEGHDYDSKRFHASIEQYRQEFETRVEKYEQALAMMADWISAVGVLTTAQRGNRMQRMVDLGKQNVAFKPLGNLMRRLNFSLKGIFGNDV